jgi:hypothetical protein
MKKILALILAVLFLFSGCGAGNRSLGISEKLPSQVTTRPIVECSFITFCVPTSAAILNGTAVSNHGVITIRGCSSSIYPSALGTI